MVPSGNVLMLDLSWEMFQSSAHLLEGVKSCNVWPSQWYCLRCQSVPIQTSTQGTQVRGDGGGVWSQCRWWSDITGDMITRGRYPHWSTSLQRPAQIHQPGSGVHKIQAIQIPDNKDDTVRSSVQFYNIITIANLHHAWTSPQRILGTIQLYNSDDILG